MVWKKKFNGAKSVFINKLYADSDSHLMASGLLFDRNSGKINEWFLMIDASGNIMWQKTINSDSGGHISDIDKTRDGGYVAAGYILRTGIKRRNALVIKTDNRGEILWQKAYGGFQSDTAAIIHQTSDRGFIVTGRTSSFGPRGGAIWVFKLNPSGVMSWQRTYNDFAPHLFPWSDQAADGGYYIGLKSDFPFYSPSDPELWLYKTDENGLIENCPLGDVTNARAESVNIVVQDAHVSTAEVELTPTRISPSTENADISRFEHCWTDWERPLEVVDWLDRVRMCPELPAEMGVVVPRRCVSGNENAFESYQLAKSLPTENIPDYLINIYSEISLGWFGMNFRVDPKETLSRLEALFAIAAAGNFYTQALKASITSRLKSTDRMDKQLLGSMVEGVNAMELDLMAPVNSKAAVSAGKHSAVDFNGIAWMIFNNVEESGSVFLKLKHGLPAFAKGMQPAWPIFTYELDFTGKIAKNGYLDLSFFIGGLNLVGRVSNARLLEWDGQSYRDITTHVDPLRSIIMGRTNRLATYVIMSPISKPIGPTSNQKAKLPYQN